MIGLLLKGCDCKLGEIITLEKSNFDFSLALVIVISQSGVSKDLIECEENVRKMGGKTLIISNNTNSPMINRSHFFFNLNADKEKSVAATKTFVMTLLVLLKLTFYSASKKKITSLIDKLSEHLIQDSKNQWNVESVDSSISTGFILSRGVGFALSNEISLKFKRLVFLPSNFFKPLKAILLMSMFSPIPIASVATRKFASPD